MPVYVFITGKLFRCIQYRMVLFRVNIILPYYAYTEQIISTKYYNRNHMFNVGLLKTKLEYHFYLPENDKFHELLQTLINCIQFCNLSCVIGKPI